MSGELLLRLDSNTINVLCKDQPIRYDRSVGHSRLAVKRLIKFCSAYSLNLTREGDR